MAVEESAFVPLEIGAARGAALGGPRRRDDRTDARGGPARSEGDHHRNAAAARRRCAAEGGDLTGMSADLGEIAQKLFEGVMAPLVLGGTIEPGHAIGARTALALGEGERRPTDPDLEGHVQLGRVRRARRLAPIDRLPPATPSEWALAAALHDVLQAANPTFDAALRRSAAVRILELARETIDRVPEPANVHEALARHSWFARVLDVARTDTSVSWWIGSRTYLGVDPPRRLQAWPELRRVRGGRDAPAASRAHASRGRSFVADRRGRAASRANSADGHRHVYAHVPPLRVGAGVAGSRRHTSRPNAGPASAGAAALAGGRRRPRAGDARSARRCAARRPLRRRRCSRRGRWRRWSRTSSARKARDLRSRRWRSRAGSARLRRW